MTDHNWELWTHQPPVLAQREKRRDILFTLKRSDRALTCWLLYRGEFGVGAQVHRNGSLFYARTFMTKPLAVAWAECERKKTVSAKGWMDA